MDIRTVGGTGGLAGPFANHCPQPADRLDRYSPGDFADPGAGHRQIGHHCRLKRRRPEYFRLLDPTITLLDSLALNGGGLRFSVLTVIKGVFALSVLV